MKYINFIFSKKISYFIIVIISIIFGFAATMINEATAAAMRAKDFSLRNDDVGLLEYVNVSLPVLVIGIHLVFYYKIKDIDKRFANLMLFLFFFFIFAYITVLILVNSMEIPYKS
jgi:hypothetical protein